MGNGSKKHHYVPQSILRRFSSDATQKQVYVFDKANSRTFPSSILNAGCENYFNTLEVEGQTVSFENLFQTNDDQLARLLRKVRIEVVEPGAPRNDPRGPFEKGRKAAKIEWVRGFHDLRQFRATVWLKNGVDVRIVQELLGHSHITTTMRYVHYLQAHAEEAVRAAEQREISGRKVDGGEVLRNQPSQGLSLNH